MFRHHQITVKGAVIDIWVETNDVFMRRFDQDEQAFGAALDLLLDTAVRAVPSKFGETLGNYVNDEEPCDDNCSTHFEESVVLKHQLMETTIKYSTHVSGVLLPPQLTVALMEEVVFNARLGAATILANPVRLAQNALAA